MNPFRFEYIQLQILSNLNTFRSEFLLMKFKSESIWFWKEHFEGLQMWIHSDTNPFKQNSNLKVLVSEGIILKVFKCEYFQIQIPFRVNTFNSENLQIEFKSEEIYMKVFISKVFLWGDTFWQPLFRDPFKPMVQFMYSRLLQKVFGMPLKVLTKFQIPKSKELCCTVFENHIKSLIQHCERSELRLHFKWTKVH